MGVIIKDRRINCHPKFTEIRAIKTGIISTIFSNFPTELNTNVYGYETMYLFSPVNFLDN